MNGPETAPQTRERVEPAAIASGQVDGPFEGMTTVERSILTLQGMAGNQAVGGLVNRPPRGWAAPPPRSMASARVGLGQLVQRQESEVPSDFEPPLISWPMEGEGVPNEPCFEGEARDAVLRGIDMAEIAATNLTARPPDLDAAVEAMGIALGRWEGAGGAEPGQGMLNEAKDLLGGAHERVSIYVVPVKDMLETLAEGASTASREATAAAAMKTDPATTPGGEAEPCFEDNQRESIAAGVKTINGAAEELGERPPDFKKTLAKLDAALAQLEAIGGSEPGNAALKAAVAILDRVAGVVEAYLTPVEDVVAQAGTDARSASARANEALEAARRGPFAPGAEGGSPYGEPT